MTVQATNSFFEALAKVHDIIQNWVLKGLKRKIRKFQQK